MFVFLSKLLPIFIYPLGLAIGFLVAALVLRRSPRWERIFMLACLGVLLIASNAWVASALTRSLEWQYLPLENLPADRGDRGLGWFDRFGAISPSDC